MNRKQLLNLIDRVHPCADFNLFFNMWLDDYDKKIKEETIIAYSNKLNEKLKADTIREIHDNFAHEMYCKGIDDFLSEICKMILQSERNGNYRFYAVEIKQSIADLAEQLKEQ